MQNKLEKMYFSQNSLKIFSQCKMKFRKRYLDGLFWSNWGLDSDETARTEKGRLFHLLAYRYFLDLDSKADRVNPEFQELAGWMESLKKFIKLSDGCSYYPEFELRINLGELRLQAKFDLIVIENNGRATIFDWKVQDKPLNRKLLQTSYQTIVYRYLLAGAGETIKGTKIAPENISMVYWQPSYPSDPVKMDYSTALFGEDEMLLRKEIGRILDCDFNSPHIKTSDRKVCRYCEFCSICNDFQPDMNSISTDEPDFDLDWDSTLEIEF